MAIINKTAVAKGTPASFTLTKSELAALAPVAADAYFSQTSNWSKVSAFYKSSLSDQREILVFDASLATPAASFDVSASARGEYQLQSITIHDFDGGNFTVQRAVLGTPFDVAFGAAAPSYVGFYSHDFQAEPVLRNGTGGYTTTESVINGATFSSGTVIMDAHLEAYLSTLTGITLPATNTIVKVRVYPTAVSGSGGVRPYIKGTQGSLALLSAFSSAVSGNTYVEMQCGVGSLSNDFLIQLEGGAGISLTIKKFEIVA